jgi:hypothetical protein
VLYCPRPLSFHCRISIVARATSTGTGTGTTGSTGAVTIIHSVVPIRTTGITSSSTVSKSHTGTASAKSTVKVGHVAVVVVAAAGG